MDVKKIAYRRKQKLFEKSAECRERLLKEHINIELPEFTDFEFATQMIPPSEMIAQVGSVDFNLYDNLASLFEKKFFKNIFTWFSVTFGSGAEKDYKRTFCSSKDTFRSTCDKRLKGDFEAAVDNNNITEILKEQLKSSIIDGYMEGLICELEQVFENMNITYMSCIDRFSSAVDDRDKYKADIVFHNMRKSNIMAIGNSTRNFMQVWDVIVHDIADDEKIEFNKILITI